jgi:hypothetical protein
MALLAVPPSLEARSEIRGRPESGYVETLDPSKFPANARSRSAKGERLLCEV